MKKSNRIQVILASLSLVMLAVVVSCTRNLSVPVTAVIMTSTFTYTPTPLVTSTFTSTPTVTNTPTLASTGTMTNTTTSTGTETATNTAGNTNTVTETNTPAPPTSTETVTNTQTVTSTQTTTNTPQPTNTQTMTMTNTATVLVTNTPSPTPSTFADFDDFDEQTDGTSYWWDFSHNPDPSAIGCTNCTCAIDPNAADAYGGAYCGGGSIQTAAQSVSVSISNFLSGGHAYFEVETQCGNCNDGQTTWSAVSDPGTNYTMSVMVNAQSGALTIAAVEVITSGGAYISDCTNFPIPVGQWGDLVVPFSALTSSNACTGDFGTNTGSNAGLLAGTDAIESIYYVIETSGGGSGVVNFDNIFFY